MAYVRMQLVSSSTFIYLTYENYILYVANERLRLACKHLYMANNICSLYLFLKDSETWRAVSIVEETREFTAMLDKRLRFESSKFCDVVIESSGLHAALSELEAVQGRKGPSALADNGGKYLKSAFSVFNATIEAFLSHQGQSCVKCKFCFQCVISKYSCSLYSPYFTSSFISSCSSCSFFFFFFL